MSKVIDNRVVSMEFDNAQFEKNVQTSMKTLDNLNKTLDKLPETSGKGVFDSLSKVFNGVKLSGISSGIEALNSKFSAFGIAGQEVIRGLTRTALNFGKSVWNNTFGQIKSGGFARASKIAAAQFSMEGMGKSWSEFADDISYAVDGTAYGLDAAAGAAAQFATAGVKAGADMKKALRGISGTAAMAGTSFEDMADVFTQVASMHKVTGDTLNRLSARNIDALSILSKHIGKTSEETRKMISQGKVDFATFAQAMDDAFGEHAKEADRTFTGVTANIRSALSKMGALFYQPLIDNDSNVVKMLEALKNKLNEVKNLMAPTVKVITDNILAVAETGKNWINGWNLKPIETGLNRIQQILKKLLPDARIAFGNFVSSFGDLKNKLGPIGNELKKSFKSIFPSKGYGGFEIINLSKRFDKFVQSLKISEDTLSKFGRIFKGAFATISLGGKIAKSAMEGLSKIFEKFDGGKVLEFFAKIGDFMVELNENYNVEKPFDTLIQVFEKLKEVAGSLFGSIPDWISKFKGLIKTTDDSDQSLEKTVSIFDKFKQALNDIGEKFDYYKNKFLTFISPVIEKIKQLAAPIVAVLKPAIKSVIDEIKKLSGNDMYGGLIKLFTNSGIVAGAFALNLLTLIKRFRDSKKSMKTMVDTLSNFAKGFSEFAKSIKSLPETVNKAIDTTSKSLKKMLDKQGFEAQAKGILYLAVAIGILAASLLLIASVPEDKIWNALAAVEALSMTVVGFMEILSAAQSVDDSVQTFKASFNKLADAFKQSSLASSMIKMAAAVLILAFAMKVMEDLDWNDIAQGLVAITVMMGELFGMAVGLDKLNVDSFNKIAASFVILASAVKILADSMVNMQGLNWDDVGQGLVAITVIMAELFGMAVGLDKLGIDSFIKIGASMFILANAIKILGDSMVAMKDMSWEDVAQGLTVITALLAEMFLLALGFQKFGIRSFIETAAGMTALAGGVSAMANAVKMLGDMDAQNLANGIVAVSIVLAELAVVVFVLSKSQGMQKAALSILAIGAAMMMMAHAFATLGQLSPEQVSQAFMALTLTLAGLAIVCYIAQDSLIKAGIGMMLIAVAMDILTIAIKSLGNADIMQLIKGMTAVAVGLTVLVVALKFVEGSILGAAALLIVAAAMVVFAAAVALLTVLPLGDLAATLLVVVVALAALALVCYLMEGAIIGAAAMLIVAAALLVLSIAVGIMAAIPFEAACAGLLALVVAILAFAGLSVLLSAALAPMAALAGILLIVSVAIVALGGGIALLGVGLEALAVYGAVGIVAFGTFCKTLAQNAPTLYKVAPVLTLMAGALLALDAGLIVCAASLVLMSAAMIAFGVASIIFAASLVATVKIIKVAIKDFKSIFSKDEFKETGENAVTGLGDGVKAGASKVWEAIKEFGRGCIDKLKSFFGSGKDSEMGKVGANAGEGFIAGLKSKLSSLGQAAKTFGSTFLSKLKGSLKEKSPSKATEEDAVYAVQGFLNGIYKNISKIGKSGEDMGNAYLDAMSTAVDEVSNAMSAAEADPTITPQMDLTQIQNGVNSMNSLLDSKRAANISANFSTGRMYEQEQMEFTQAQLTGLGNQLSALAAIMANQPTPVVEANVNLLGEAQGIFRAVQSENARYTKMHGKSALA